MLKSELQHQYRVTKKTIQRKLGGKEDECIVNSDQILDSKIELFKSISKTSFTLFKIVDLYQERQCILAQEEQYLGKFLKENGKLSSTSKMTMIAAGKSISYCGQQRMTVRAPLIRLYNEMETFRMKAISDTKHTIEAMERERTEYRASLNWMKSVSAQLDPDSDKGLDKFRKAQNQVRLSKQKFDRLSLDCLEKIDLLAAARCNLFSHVLVAYQSAMYTFASKTLETFKAASKVLQNEPHYSFTILKDLTQTDKAEEACEIDKKENYNKEVPVEDDVEKNVDMDQALFFKDDFTDEKKPGIDDLTERKEPVLEESFFNFEDFDAFVQGPPAQDLAQETTSPKTKSSALIDVVDEIDEVLLKSNASSYMPSQLLLQNIDFLSNDSTCPLSETSQSSMTQLLNPSLLPLKSDTKAKPKETSKFNANKNKSKKDMSTWFQLFSELDPLENPEAFSKQEDGENFCNNAA